MKIFKIQGVGFSRIHSRTSIPIQFHKQHQDGKNKTRICLLTSCAKNDTSSASAKSRHRNKTKVEIVVKVFSTDVLIVFSSFSSVFCISLCMLRYKIKIKLFLLVLELVFLSMPSLLFSGSTKSFNFKFIRIHVDVDLTGSRSFHGTLGLISWTWRGGEGREGEAVSPIFSVTLNSQKAYWFGCKR